MLTVIPMGQREISLMRMINWYSLSVCDVVSIERTRSFEGSTRETQVGSREWEQKEAELNETLNLFGKVNTSPAMKTMHNHSTDTLAPMDVKWNFISSSLCGNEICFYDWSICFEQITETKQNVLLSCCPSLWKSFDARFNVKYIIW